jgi:hypothetical protein
MVYTGDELALQTEWLPALLFGTTSRAWLKQRSDPCTKPRNVISQLLGCRHVDDHDLWYYHCGSWYSNHDLWYFDELRLSLHGSQYTAGFFLQSTTSM